MKMKINFCYDVTIVLFLQCHQVNKLVKKAKMALHRTFKKKLHQIPQNVVYHFFYENPLATRI